MVSQNFIGDISYDQNSDTLHTNALSNDEWRQLLQTIPTEKLSKLQHIVMQIQSAKQTTLNGQSLYPIDGHSQPVERKHPFFPNFFLHKWQVIVPMWS